MSKCVDRVLTLGSHSLGPLDMLSDRRSEIDTSDIAIDFIMITSWNSWEGERQELDL